jgi:hypothetical protein
MAHCGVSLEHSDNAGVIARMTAPHVIKDRPGLIRKLEELQARKPNAAIDRVLFRLRNNIPDPPIPASESPQNVNPIGLGTHPDIVERLWKIGRELPTDCAWVAFRRPVPAHSATGIIFGLGIGTLGYALRLPPEYVREAQASGAQQTRSGLGAKKDETYSLTNYGPDWWFGRWGEDEDRRWSQAAYVHFGAR